MCVTTSLTTGQVTFSDYQEADIYQLEVVGNTAYIAGILTRYIFNGGEVDLAAEPGRMMIRLVDNGEGKQSTADVFSLFVIAAEVDVQDPNNPPFDVNDPFWIGILGLRSFQVTRGNIVVQDE